MAYNDKECNCDSYCECETFAPCSCAGMAKDPHCANCSQHLKPEHEAAWRYSETYGEVIPPYKGL
jgi:hypothetical protein